jgi:hypothetical protein
MGGDTVEHEEFQLSLRGLGSLLASCVPLWVPFMVLTRGGCFCHLGDGSQGVGGPCSADGPEKIVRDTDLNCGSSGEHI